jgi:poly(A) polymerase
MTEFKRGRDTVKSILEQGGKYWDRLFEPSDFFVKYSQYISCNIITGGDDEISRGWIGFVESRLRKLPSYLDDDQAAQGMPKLSSLHLYPVCFRLKNSPNVSSYFIGFNVAPSKQSKEGPQTINLEGAISTFWNYDLRKYSGEQNAIIDFAVEHFKWGHLPHEVFEVLGGAQAAKAKRVELANKLKAAKAESEAEATKAAEENTARNEARLAEGVDGLKTTLQKRKLSFDETGYGGNELQIFSLLPRLQAPSRFVKRETKVPRIVTWTVLDQK